MASENAAADVTRTSHEGGTKIKIVKFDPTNKVDARYELYQSGRLRAKVDMARKADKESKAEGHWPAVVTLSTNGENCMAWLHSTARIAKNTRLPLMEHANMWQLITGEITFRDYHDTLARRNHFPEVNESGARAALRAPGDDVPPPMADITAMIPPGAMGTPTSEEANTTYMHTTGGNHIQAEADQAQDPRRLWRTRPSIAAGAGTAAGHTEQCGRFYEGVVACWEDLHEEAEQCLLTLVDSAFQRHGGVLRSALFDDRSTGPYARYTKHAAIATDDIGFDVGGKKGRQRLVCQDADKTSARGLIVYVSLMRFFVPNLRDVTEASKAFLETAVDRHGNSIAYDWTCDDHRQVVTNIRNQLEEYNLLLRLPALASDPVHGLTQSERARVAMAQIGIGTIVPPAAAASIYNTVQTLCVDAQQDIDDGKEAPEGYADHVEALLRRIETKLEADKRTKAKTRGKATAGVVTSAGAGMVPTPTQTGGHPRRGTQVPAAAVDYTGSNDAYASGQPLYGADVAAGVMDELQGDAGRRGAQPPQGGGGGRGARYGTARPYGEGGGGSSGWGGEPRPRHPYLPGGMGSPMSGGPTAYRQRQQRRRPPRDAGGRGGGGRGRYGGGRGPYGPVRRLPVHAVSTQMSGGRVARAVQELVRRTGRPVDDWDVSMDGELLVWQDGCKYNAGAVTDFAGDMDVAVNYAAAGYYGGEALAGDGWKGDTSTATTKRAPTLTATTITVRKMVGRLNTKRRRRGM